MKDLNIFISNFLKRSGNYIFISMVVSRLLSLGASWIAIQLIPNKELGAVIFAFQIISFIMPVSGFGLNQGLIRYGALLSFNKEKNSLFIYTLKKGLIISFMVMLIIMSVSFFIDFDLELTKPYLILLSLALLTHYLFDLIKIQFRLQKNNKTFAFIEVTYNVIYIILVFSLSWFFKELGYAIAIIITPLFSSILFINKLNLKQQNNQALKIINFKFWKYGFFASLSNVTTQLLISIDIILIGSILNDLEQITAFKYVSLIPFSLIFLSQVVITTDFVEFTEKIKQKKFIKNYIKNYIKIFTLISITCILFVAFFGKSILHFFDNEYSNYNIIMLILTIGISGILILRGLFGNLLSSLGKAHINFYITGLAVVLNVVLNLNLIPKYGILGASITSAFLMWFTGILAGFSFYFYYKKAHLK